MCLQAAALEEAHTQLSSELTETRAELRTVQASLAYEQERANRCVPCTLCSGLMCAQYKSAGEACDQRVRGSAA